MATTFDGIINRLDNLKFEDWNELDSIRPLATELLKRSFPTNNASDVFKIESIKFKATRGSEFWGTSDGNQIEAWNAGVAKFKAIIQAKKETYDIQTQARIRFEQEKAAIRINPFEAEILELKKNILDTENKHEKILIEYRNEFEKQNKNIETLNTQLKFKDAQLTATSNRVRKYNGIFWTIIIGVPSLLFTVGYYLGNNRFDADKLSMRDTISNNRVQNQILRDSISKISNKKPVK